MTGPVKRWLAIEQRPPLPARTPSGRIRLALDIVSIPLSAGLAMIAMLAAFTFLGMQAAQAVGAEACANEAIRTEQGLAALRLPDCRAYEMVTPAAKGSGESEAINAG